MTSRVSFSKLTKETLKRHTTSLLVVVLAFVIHFIVIFLSLHNMTDYIMDIHEEYFQIELARMFCPNYANGFFALALGLFLAFDYFRYLHSRKESDFYESLPVTRTQRFLSNSVCAALIFSILSIITFALEFLILVLFGMGSRSIFVGAFWNLIIMLGVFLASYVTAALAFIMTGHLLIALLGYGAFNLYIPVLIRNLFPTFANIYFDTYVEMARFSKWNWQNIFFYLSPGSLMYQLMDKSNSYWEADGHIHYFIALVLFIVIVGYLALYLYKKRPAEAAGRAMVFEKYNSLIRILIVIPFSLYIGIFLRDFSYSLEDIWMLFGIVFGGFIVHGILEAIYEADVKAAFRKKKQLLATYVVCFIFIAIFRFDIFHYDDYIPKASKVETVYIDLGSHYPFDITEYDPDGLKGEYAELALQLAEYVTENQKSFDSNQSYSIVTFEFELKNGVIISRDYRISMSNPPELLEKLSLELEFKDDYCMLYNFDINNLSGLQYASNYEEYVIDSTLWNAIINAYIEEFSKLSHSDFYNIPCECQIIVTEPHEDGYENSYWFPVYANFTKTINLLQEANYIPFHENPDIIITHLELYDDKYEDVRIIDDLELLAEMKPYLHLSNYNYYLQNDEYFHGSAIVNGAGQESYFEVYISKEDLEQFR